MYRKWIALFSLLLLFWLGTSRQASFAFPSEDGTVGPAISSILEREYFQGLGMEMPGGGVPPVAEEPAAKPNEPAVQPVTYQVLPGDTLYRIASEFNLNLDVLMSVNSIQNPKALQVGQKLQIPNLDNKLSGSGQSIDKVLSATLTAYTAGYESTGKRPSDPQYGITFSGSKVQEGRTVAVDPSVIPLGSTVYIEGIGIRKAEDTGSAIHGKKIDVFISDLDEAREFGVKQNVKVYVLSSAA